jgi:hypothetical protein
MSKSILQIISSFIGGTVFSAGVLKAVNQKDIYNIWSSTSNDNAADTTPSSNHRQHLSAPYESNDSIANSEDGSKSEDTSNSFVHKKDHAPLPLPPSSSSATDINLALLSSLTVVIGLSIVYFTNKTIHFNDQDEDDGGMSKGGGQLSNVLKYRVDDSGESNTQMLRLEKDIETWRKRYKEKMREILQLKKKVVQVQRNAELTFGQGMEDNVTLIHENSSLRKRNIKLERQILEIENKLEKLRLAYLRAGPRSSIFGKKREVIDAEQNIKRYLRKLTPRKSRQTYDYGGREKSAYPPSPPTNKQQIVDNNNVHSLPNMNNKKRREILRGDKNV